MNLPAIILAYLFSKLFVHAGVLLLMATPSPPVLALFLEPLSMVFGGFMLAHLKVQKPVLNAGILALVAGVMLLVSNHGGLHWLRFLVMLTYAPAAMWGARRFRRR